MADPPTCRDTPFEEAARDRFVARHPKLIFVGAHLASLEWSVDELTA